MKDKEVHKYDDIIDLSHPEPVTKPRMTMQERAAQFSPFAALTGHGAAIKETARLTEEKIELGEDDLRILNEKIAFLQSVIDSRPHIKVTYFAQDLRKSGGSYETCEGRLKKADAFLRALIFTDGASVPFDDITDIEIIFTEDYDNEKRTDQGV